MEPCKEISNLEKETSQFSLEDCCPLKMESCEQGLQMEETKASPSNSFKRKILNKPKTEIYMDPLNLKNEETEEDLTPILERRKNRESTHKANPFSNLSRFSSRTWIRNSTTPLNKHEISPLSAHDNKPKSFLKSSLQAHFLFKEWDPFLLEKLVNELWCAPLKANEVLLDKETPIKSFYIVAKGSVELITTSSTVTQYKIGDILCISSIFQDLQSGIEIRGLEESVLWGLEFVKFQELLKSNAYSALQENRAFLEKVQYFDNLSNENKVEIAFYLKTEKYKKGDLVLNDCKNSEHLFIVKSGMLKMNRNPEEDSIEIKFYILKEKEVFGEDKYGSEMEFKNVFVDDHCEEAILLSICKKTLRLILGTKYSGMVHIHEFRNLLKQSKFLLFLDPILKEKIIRKLKVTEAKKGDVLWDNQPKKLLFLLKGELVTEKGEPIVVQKGIFDEDALLNEKFQRSFKQLIMACDGFYAEISWEKLATVLKTNNIHEYFAMMRQVFKKDSLDLSSPYSPFIHIKSISSSLKGLIREIRTAQKYEHIRILKEIGDGQFGLVLLAKIEDRYFALKVISRFWVIQNCCEEYLINEKRICRMIDSPFIIHLDFTFRDQYNIYFLFEYIEGLDLFKFMNISGIIPTPIAQFYAANLILAIEYLHNKGIIHRDLKPENIMIAKNGYLKVIDLGAAKLLNDEDNSKNSTTTFQKEESDSPHVPLMRTFTLIGTPEYLAPETIRGTGYHFPVDLWALGVIIYEMLCGYCPFGQNESEPIKIYQSILEDELKFPKFIKDSKAKKLIRQLLSKSPEERSEGSFNALKAKKWFDDVLWNEIAAQKPNLPSYIPENKDAEKEKQQLLAKNITLRYVLENSSLEELKKQAELGGVSESDNPNWDEIF